MTPRRVDVPTDLTSKDALLAFYARSFDFPRWWGRNWDALYDLLSAPGLVAGGPIDVHHAALPALPPDTLEVYREVLDDAVERHAGALRVRWPDDEAA